MTDLNAGWRLVVYLVHVEIELHGGIRRVDWLWGADDVKYLAVDRVLHWSDPLCHLSDHSFVLRNTLDQTYPSLTQMYQPAVESLVCVHHIC